MTDSPRAKAQAIWKDVTGAMPAELQEGRALVEAWRQAMGACPEDILGPVYDALDRLAVETFGPNQIEPVPHAPKSSSGPARLSEAELRAGIESAIAQVFSAPTDGSKDRADVLKARAMGTVDRTIESNASHLGWLARRRLRKAAKASVKALYDSAIT